MELVENRFVSFSAGIPLDFSSNMNCKFAFKITRGDCAGRALLSQGALINYARRVWFTVIGTAGKDAKKCAFTRYSKARHVRGSVSGAYG